MAAFDDIAVLTSENVRLNYTLAGMGSRMAAFLADSLIVFLLSVAVTGLFTLFGMSPNEFGEVDLEKHSLAFAFYIIVMFLLFWGYYFLFEWMSWGQTPGKQLLGIRVSMADGAPADIVACATRNVVRILDLVLAGLGITFFIMIFTPRYQRLGDLVAGTVVVRRRRLSFEDVYSAAMEADRAIAAVAAATEGTAIITRIRLDDAERELIEKFIERRESLPADVRNKLAADLAKRIRPRVSGETTFGLSNEELIEAALASQPRIIT